MYRKRGRPKVGEQTLRLCLATQTGLGVAALAGCGPVPFRPAIPQISPRATVPDLQKITKSTRM